MATVSGGGVAGVECGALGVEDVEEVEVEDVEGDALGAAVDRAADGDGEFGPAAEECPLSTTVTTTIAAVTMARVARAVAAMVRRRFFAPLVVTIVSNGDDGTD